MNISGGLAVYIPGLTPLTEHLDAVLPTISRTFAGVSDTSTSHLKRPLSIEGRELSLKASDRFEKTVRWLVRDLEILKKTSADPNDVFMLLHVAFEQVNKDLLPREYGVWRAWSARQHVEPEQIEEAYNKFCCEFFTLFRSTETDPIALAAWVEKTLNNEIHPFYDGCGRVSRALSSAILARNKIKWPLFSSRDEYFQEIEGPLSQWTESYRERIRLIDELFKESRETFHHRLEALDFSPSLVNLVDDAYCRAKAGHRGQFRDGELTAMGEAVRYFEHPRNVALICTDDTREELRTLPQIIQAVLIIGALLHDLPEDTDHMGAKMKALPGDPRSWRERIAENIDRLDPRHLFAFKREELGALPYQSLGLIVLALTKPTDEELATQGIMTNDPEFRTKREAMATSLVQSGGPIAVALKAYDRIANFRTMENLNAKRIVQKINETETFLEPVLRDYSDRSKGMEIAPLIARLASMLECEILRIKARPDVRGFSQGPSTS